MINIARRLLKGSLAFLGGRVDGVYAQSSGTNADHCVGVAVDPSGNYFMTGYTPLGVGVVAKLPQNLASVTWQRKQTLTSFLGVGIGVDSSGNAYATGQGTSGVTAPHIFKYAAAGGAVSVQRKLTAAESQNIYAPAVNSSGDVYVAISNGNAANPYGHIGKYNSSLTIQWQRQLSHTYDTAATGVALNASGDVIGIGYFRDGADAIGNERGVVFKAAASDGVLAWQYKIHFSVQGRWNYVAVDQVTGDILVGGYALIGGNQKGTIALLDSDGAVSWHAVHPTTNELVTAVAVESQTGDVFVGMSDNTVSCFDSSGTLKWNRLIAAQTSVSVRGLAFDGDILLVAMGADKTSEGSNAAILRLPRDSGGLVGTYGIITTTDPGAVAWTTGSITSASAGMTEGAGTLTDAAGSFVDDAQTLTFTPF